MDRLRRNHQDTKDTKNIEVSWWFRLFAPIACICLAITLLAGCTAGSGGSGDKVKLIITPVDTPTTTPLAAPTMAPTTYTVKSGDTLSGIAALFGVSVDDIVRANNIADPNRLSEGQVLTIPVRPSGSPPEAAPPQSGTPQPPGP